MTTDLDQVNNFMNHMDMDMEQLSENGVVDALAQLFEERLGGMMLVRLGLMDLVERFKQEEPPLTQSAFCSTRNHLKESTFSKWFQPMQRKRIEIHAFENRCQKAGE